MATVATSVGVDRAAVEVCARTPGASLLMRRTVGGVGVFALVVMGRRAVPVCARIGARCLLRM